MNKKSSFQDVGLPEGYAYPALTFHSPTGFIIAQTRPRKPVLPCQRLSMRRLKEARYSPIGDFPPSVSIQSYALSPKLPVLYFITYIWSEHVNGPPGGNWDALYRFSLDTHLSEVVARRGELVPPEGYQSAWLADLFSVSENDCTLYRKAALLKEKEPIDYCLTELSIKARKVEILTRLEAVFA